MNKPALGIRPNFSPILVSGWDAGTHVSQSMRNGRGETVFFLPEVSRGTACRNIAALP
jgi:hypothetical protein